MSVGRNASAFKNGAVDFSFAGTPIHCLIIDESSFGVMLETMVIAEVPENIKIRFVGGPTLAALRCYA